jgi:serine/threonine protein kinase
MNHAFLVRYFAYQEAAVYHHKDGSQSLVDYIVQELVDGYELWDIIAIPRMPFSERICRYYFKQMLFALHYMHSNGVCHRDLKLNNIMIDKRDSSLKIIDFGFATELEGRQKDGFCATYLGTPGFMAPEILQKQRY